MSIALAMTTPIADRTRLGLLFVVSAAIVCTVVGVKFSPTKMDAISANRPARYIAYRPTRATPSGRN